MKGCAMVRASDRRGDDVASWAYVLGHSEQELARLTEQARIVGPITRRFFSEAGLVPGMRVLDVGSGVGDVSFLASDFVGETGAIVGVDRSSAAVEAARARALACGRSNVSFREGDPAEMKFDEPFDAVIGRFVLIFQSDPAAMLAKLAEHVRPGGLIVFHEIDLEGCQSFPPLHIYDSCCRWITETTRLLGFNPRMGMRLHAIFVAAGLPAPTLRLEAAIGGGANSLDCLRLVGDVVPVLLHEILRLGVATAAEIGVETLAERMANEAISNDSVIVGRLEIGAWCRV
jgi:2-polyprenyl-3-methyl-5-hydroxy-6-metoxy-1,4-benzoquinol methylase